MISFKEFNRNKNRSVLFLHGLFSSSGYWLEYLREFRDFKIILCDIDYENFSGLSNEIKSKLDTIRPKTLGQALRIDGVTPAAAIILLAFIKKSRYKVSA